MSTDIDLKKAEELEREFDTEVRFRPVLPPASWIVAGLLFVLSCFHFYTAGFGLLRETTHRGIHMAFVIGLIFLVFALNRSKADKVRPSSVLSPGGVPLLDWALTLAAVAAALYIPFVFHDLAFRVGNPLLSDVVMGSVLIIVVLEATRRTMGWPLVIIALAFIAYALSGPWMPGILVHPGAQWSEVVNHLYLTSQGIYGIPIGVVATYVFHYVLFGVLAMRIGLGQLFLDLAMAVAGRYAGGPAKVSIFGSALFGMISGSSVANAVTVGSLTIPMMTRLGYQRHFAAGVEATASTGGQITPPVMGAAAFLMVEYLGVPYQTIIIAAILPAFMHFFGVFVQVHFEAKRYGLRGVAAEDLPRLSQSLKRDWPTLIPLFGLLIVLFADYTPYVAAFTGILLCLVVGLVRRRGGGPPPIIETALVVLWFLFFFQSRPYLPQIMLNHFEEISGVTMIALLLALWRLNRFPRMPWTELVDGFVVGAKYALAVGAAAACVGIIVGVVTLTGVGFKIAFITVEVARALSASGPVTAVAGLLGFTSGDQALVLFFTLVLLAIVCILMGCGIPTTSTYIIMVAVAAPALKMLGVPDLVGHFFVFYYGVLADITPPVAVAAYAAASMANADPFKTGNTAFRLALGKALVPFVFVYSPVLLLVMPGFSWGEFVVTVGGCLVGIVMLSAAFAGWLFTHMSTWERWLIGIASLPVIAPGLTPTLVGLAAGVPVLVSQIVKARGAPAAA